MARISFGLSSSNKKYIYEEIFTCVRHCKLTFSEAWDLPVEVRKWWIDRTNKAIKKEQAAEGSGEGHVDPHGRKYD